MGKFVDFKKDFKELLRKYAKLGYREVIDGVLEILLMRKRNANWELNSNNITERSKILDRCLKLLSNSQQTKD